MQKETKYIAIRIPLKKCFVKNEKKINKTISRNSFMQLYFPGGLL